MESKGNTATIRHNEKFFDVAQNFAFRNEALTPARDALKEMAVRHETISTIASEAISTFVGPTENDDELEQISKFLKEASDYASECSDSIMNLFVSDIKKLSDSARECETKDEYIGTLGELISTIEDTEVYINRINIGVCKRFEASVYYNGVDASLEEHMAVLRCSGISDIDTPSEYISLYFYNEVRPKLRYLHSMVLEEFSAQVRGTEAPNINGNGNRFELLRAIKEQKQKEVSFVMNETVLPFIKKHLVEIQRMLGDNDRSFDELKKMLENNAELDVLLDKATILVADGADERELGKNAVNMSRIVSIMQLCAKGAVGSFHGADAPELADEPLKKTWETMGYYLDTFKK